MSVVPFHGRRPSRGQPPAIGDLSDFRADAAETRPDRLVDGRGEADARAFNEKIKDLEALRSAHEASR
jgi:hypothetical protein